MDAFWWGFMWGAIFAVGAIRAIKAWPEPQRDPSTNDHEWYGE